MLDLVCCKSSELSLVVRDCGSGGSFWAVGIESCGGEAGLHNLGACVNTNLGCEVTGCVAYHNLCIAETLGP